MDVVNAHFEFFNRNIVSYSDFVKNFVNALTDLTLKNLLAILGCPDNVILRIVNRVRCASKSHNFIVTITHRINF